MKIYSNIYFNNFALILVVFIFIIRGFFMRKLALFLALLTEALGLPRSRLTHEFHQKLKVCLYEKNLALLTEISAMMNRDLG